MKRIGIAVAICFIATGALAQDGSGGDASNAVAIDTMQVVFERLGYSTTVGETNLGGKVIVVDDAPDFAEAFAVFFNDCGSAGCEEMTLYADLGNLKSGSLEFVNDWNHFNSGFRSTAFLSGPDDAPDGEVGLTMHLSMYGDDEADTLAMLSGIFLLEAELFYSRAKSQDGEDQ